MAEQKQSRRFKPEQSYRQSETNWRTGIDKVYYTTTTLDSSKQSASASVEELKAAAQRPRINKNSSNGPAIIGQYVRDTATATKEHFTTACKAEFNPGTTALSSQYEKMGPAFDRITSNKTNYTLGKHPAVTKSTITSHYNHPNDREAALQPNLGGWMLGDNGKGSHALGRYKTSIESDESIMRGGGGGEGNLGVQFNIITGASDSEARSRQLARTGPRNSLNLQNRSWQNPLQTGEAHPADIISRRVIPHPAVPPKATAASLMRPDEPILRTRPW